MIPGGEATVGGLERPVDFARTMRNAITYMPVNQEFPIHIVIRAVADGP